MVFKVAMAVLLCSGVFQPKYTALVPLMRLQSSQPWQNGWRYNGYSNIGREFSGIRSLEFNNLFMRRAERPDVSPQLQ